jgi:prepilin-type N-terminal cleavage/methylation domain-containing protein
MACPFGADHATQLEKPKSRNDAGLRHWPWALGHSLGHSRFITRHSAFTLVEMIVVIAVILVLVGIVLPAATTMWSQRRISEAQNTVQGLLRSTRAKAFQGERGDVGLFFYVDERGVQQIVTITRSPFDPDDPPENTGGDLPPESRWQSDCGWRDVYTVAAEGRQAMPPGMRVVPRYAIDDPPSGGDSFAFFSAEELANDDFTTVVEDQAQRHRNFFSVLFAADGRLLTGRDVLIRDRDEDPDGDPRHGFGDVTGLTISDDAQRYFAQNGAPATIGGEACVPADSALSDLVVEPGGTTALNFRSVDGILVHDDSLFKDAGTPEERRRLLVESAQPFYIHHLTGAVVKGPSGENEPAEPGP